MKVVPVGRRALLVELDELSAVQALYQEIERRRQAGQLRAVDVVPAARSVLLDGVDDPHALGRDLLRWQLAEAPPPQERRVSIPTRYDGPDLPEVAQRCGLTVAEVVEAHAAATFAVAFCGFMPGFAYLSGVPDRLTMPRRTRPRTAVPAGSVGLAGEFTGVYPRSSPGGWQLIGRTDAVLWDPRRSPPALLGPATVVRFVPLPP
jgi:KipI family sensor histidine kinase inhibitor